MYDLSTVSPLPLAEFLETFKAFPADLLPLVLDNLPTEPEQAQDNGYGNPPGWFAEMLNSEVPVGQRRPSLTKLAGTLRGHGIPEEVAVALGVAWARWAFIEPLEDTEVERHITGVYHRYGVRTLSLLERRSYRRARAMGV